MEVMSISSIILPAHQIPDAQHYSALESAAYKEKTQAVSFTYTKKSWTSWTSEANSIIYKEKLGHTLFLEVSHNCVFRTNFLYAPSKHPQREKDIFRSRKLNKMVHLTFVVFTEVNNSDITDLSRTPFFNYLYKKKCGVLYFCTCFFPQMFKTHDSFS